MENNLLLLYFLEPLIEAVQEISFQNKETILYGINVLKSLLFRDMIEHQHLEECAAILLQHLSQFNDLVSSLFFILQWKSVFDSQIFFPANHVKNCIKIKLSYISILLQYLHFM